MHGKSELAKRDVDVKAWEMINWIAGRDKQQGLWWKLQLGTMGTTLSSGSAECSTWTRPSQPIQWQHQNSVPPNWQHPQFDSSPNVIIGDFASLQNIFKTKWMWIIFSVTRPREHSVWLNAPHQFHEKHSGEFQQIKPLYLFKLKLLLKKVIFDNGEARKNHWPFKETNPTQKEMIELNQTNSQFECLFNQTNHQLETVTNESLFGSLKLMLKSISHWNFFFLWFSPFSHLFFPNWEKLLLHLTLGGNGNTSAMSIAIEWRNERMKVHEWWCAWCNGSSNPTHMH